MQASPPQEDEGEVSEWVVVVSIEILARCKAARTLLTHLEKLDTEGRTVQVGTIRYIPRAQGFNTSIPVPLKSRSLRVARVNPCIAAIAAIAASAKSMGLPAA